MSLATQMPNRVVCNRYGEARPPERVPNRTSTIVFVRDDGWTLGADEAHPEEVLVAYKLWPDEWKCAIRLPDRVRVRIADLLSECCRVPMTRSGMCVDCRRNRGGS